MTCGWGLIISSGLIAVKKSSYRPRTVRFMYKFLPRLILSKPCNVISSFLLCNIFSDWMIFSFFSITYYLYFNLLFIIYISIYLYFNLLFIIYISIYLYFNLLFIIYIS